jgi:hypothetical protein
MDDDYYDTRYLGIGAATPTDRRTPSKKERVEVAKQQPIGFVHFKETECLIVPPASALLRSKKRAANSGSANAKRAGKGSARSKKNAPKSSR